MIVTMESHTNQPTSTDRAAAAHIVIDARNMPTSTGRYVEMLVRYLEKIDSEHRYSILMYPDKMDKWQPTNPNFAAVPCPHREFSFGEQLGLKRQIDRLQPDLVHFSMVQQPIFYRSSPVVTTMHDLTTIRFRNPAKNWLVFNIKRLIYILVNHVAARKSRRVITPTDFVRRDVAHFTRVSADKITYTHEAVDDFDEPEQVMPSFEGKRFIMFNGRPTPHKNLHRLIDAFAILHQQDPDLYLMLAGKVDESYDSYVQQIQSLGLAERVVLTDFIPDGQLKWAMRHCQAYIWPSLSEGFGLPPLEAMLHGAPVVSSNASCMPEVLGNAAHYFDPKDTKAMARAIQDVLHDAQLRDTLTAKGKEQVRRYSWERMAKQTLDIYNDILDKKRTL
ncbi:glycosyl transferase family 1 [Candidatus Saccharibacteria bacterium]|nr:MAG: glycosyl transferase family 1 [Candidatus Saccharibacteria bacterium]